jgi:TPP-dependent pyruvate/acetoin dehydrogenase alpha subunit
MKEKTPYFLEFSTYRWREHCGPNFDDDLGYRDEKEVKNWIKNCPLKKIEADLYDYNKVLTEIKIRVDKEVKTCFSEAENAPFPDQKEAYNDVYA